MSKKLVGDMEEKVLDSEKWFTEVMGGSAFSLKLEERCHKETTPFQEIEILKTETFGHLMVIDGCVMLTTRDNFLYHEMMTHPVLFTHPEPKKVWIIGGGDCGSLKEVLKHSGVEEAVQIEIDERVTRLSEQYFPELCTSNNDPRADLKFIDGIDWVKNAPDNCVDIIIVDSTDPVGPAEGLFNKAFYQQCLRCLGDKGILIQQSESPLLHADLIGEMKAQMVSAGFRETRSLFFPQPVYPSGWWSATMAGNGLGDIISPEKIPFETRYYTAEMHKAAFAKPAFL